jgi:hypothetical protein
MNRHELNEAAKPLNERTGAVHPSGYPSRWSPRHRYFEDATFKAMVDMMTGHGKN